MLMGGKTTGNKGLKRRIKVESCNPQVFSSHSLVKEEKSKTNFCNIYQWLGPLNTIQIKFKKKKNRKHDCYRNKSGTNTKARLLEHLERI